MLKEEETMNVRMMSSLIFVCSLGLAGCASGTLENPNAANDSAIRDPVVSGVVAPDVGPRTRPDGRSLADAATDLSIDGSALDDAAVDAGVDATDLDAMTDGGGSEDGGLVDGGTADGAVPPPPDFEVVLWTEHDKYVRTDGLNGSVDIARTQAAIKDLGATTLSMVVKSDADYRAFVSFLEATKKTKIKTWAMMPWNCKNKEALTLYPDCPSWAAHFAKLALKYPKFQVMRLDDLAPTAPRHSLATPEWFREILSAKNAVNPKFRVIPVMYYDVREEMELCTKGQPFHGVFEDGVTFPYWASFRGVDHVNLTKLRDYVDRADSQVHPIPFITTIYPTSGGTLNRTRDPDKHFYDPALLKDMLQIATSKSDGLGLFWFPLYIYDIDHLLKATLFKQQPSDDASYAYRLTNSGKTAITSWHQSIKTRVAAGKVRVTFDAKDTARKTAECGWLIKQVLAGGRVVWSKDVCEDGNERETISATTTTTAPGDLVIRIFAPKANSIPVSLYVDDPKVTVDGKPALAGWAFDSNLANMTDYVQMYRAVRSVLKGR